MTTMFAYVSDMDLRKTFIGRRVAYQRQHNQARRNYLSLYSDLVTPCGGCGSEPLFSLCAVQAC